MLRQLVNLKARVWRDEPARFLSGESARRCDCRHRYGFHLRLRRAAADALQSDAVLGQQERVGYTTVLGHSKFLSSAMPPQLFAGRFFYLSSCPCCIARSSDSVRFATGMTLLPLAVYADVLWALLARLVGTCSCVMQGRIRGGPTSWRKGWRRGRGVWLRQRTCGLARIGGYVSAARSLMKRWCSWRAFPGWAIAAGAFPERGADAGCGSGAVATRRRIGSSGKPHRADRNAPGQRYWYQTLVKV